MLGNISVTDSTRHFGVPVPVDPQGNGPPTAVESSSEVAPVSGSVPTMQPVPLPPTSPISPDGVVASPSTTPAHMSSSPTMDSSSGAPAAVVAAASNLVVESANPSLEDVGRRIGCPPSKTAGVRLHTPLVYPKSRITPGQYPAPNWLDHRVFIFNLNLFV